MVKINHRRTQGWYILFTQKKEKENAFCIPLKKGVDLNYTFILGLIKTQIVLVKLKKKNWCDK